MQQYEYILNVRFVKQKESDTRVHIVWFRLHEIQSQAKLICAVPSQDSDYHWRHREWLQGRPKGLFRVLVMLFIDLSVFVKIYLALYLPGPFSMHILIKKKVTPHPHPETHKTIMPPR